VVAVDAAKKTLALGRRALSYDRLVLSPGVDFMFDQIPGLKSADAQSKILHAWKAGPQTVALRKQLEHEGRRRLRHRHPQGALPLPARALRARLPGGQLLQAEQAEVQGAHARRQRGRHLQEGLFTKAWSDLYKGILEYRNNSELKDVDVATTAVLEFDKFKADVLNVIRPSAPATSRTSRASS
jgi:sulfite dehydrogenase